ncbi:hypothetical protein Gpo141_00003194 [Globisporangium polare]
MKPIGLDGNHEPAAAADRSTPSPHPAARVTITAAPRHAAADVTFVHAPASADDVPPSVRAAVAEFEPPPGFEPFPTPTKNNLQRSLIYFFGRRVQSSATGKSQWFCLASPQCRANKTTISTTANISGCTRHLQVFHRLISPKTAQMTRKASSQQERLYHIAEAPLSESLDTSQSVEEHEQLQSDTVDLTVAPKAVTQAKDDDSTGGERLKHLSDREIALAWTLAVVIRNLLPVSLACDDRLVQLTRPTTTSSTERTLDEKSVRHHLVELYDAVSSILTAMLQKELVVSALPILHLALIPVGGADDDAFLALQVTFVSSTFAHEKHVLDVRRFPDSVLRAAVNSDTSSQSNSSSSLVHAWIQATLQRFGIEKKHVHSFVIDRTLSASPLAIAASAFLGRSCESSCLSTCTAALCGDALSAPSESSVWKLVAALHEFIEIACNVDFVSCFRGVESHVEEFMSAAAELKSLQVSRQGLFPWNAVALILECVVQSWDACQEVFHTPSGEEGASLSEGISSPTVVPQLLRGFSREDVTQCASILRPLGEFFSDLDSPESVCAEATIRMFAIKQTTLNAARSVQVTLLPSGQDHHPESEEVDRDEHHHEAGDIDPHVAVVEHSQLSVFARSLHEELARYWDTGIAEKLTSDSLSAVTCVFFHPCFRHLSFLDGYSMDVKSQVHDHVKGMARDVLDWKAKQNNSSLTRGNSEADNDQSGDNDDTPLKKRRISRQEKLSKQAAELSRLGFLDAFATSSSSNSSLTALNGDQEQESSEADWSAVDLIVSRELERYLKYEAVAFAAVSFDKILPYWQHKAFDFPTLALVAQAVLGHPAVLTQQQHRRQAMKNNNSRQRDSGSCIRCCFGGQSRLPYNKQIRDETQVFEELTLFLHHNEQLLNESELQPPPELSEAKAAHVVATLVAERRRQQQQQATPVENASIDPSIIQV